jgi:hypothetical protein
MNEPTHSRKHRIQLLVRRNGGHTKFKAYFEELAGLLRVEIADSDRLDLEATDQLFTAILKSRCMNRPEYGRANALGPEALCSDCQEYSSSVLMNTAALSE